MVDVTRISIRLTFMLSYAILRLPKISSFAVDSGLTIITNQYAASLAQQHGTQDWHWFWISEFKATIIYYAPGQHRLKGLHNLSEMQGRKKSSMDRNPVSVPIRKQPNPNGGHQFMRHKHFCSANLGITIICTWLIARQPRWFWLSHYCMLLVAPTDLWLTELPFDFANNLGNIGCNSPIEEPSLLVCHRL